MSVSQRAFKVGDVGMVTAEGEGVMLHCQRAVAAVEHRVHADGAVLAPKSHAIQPLQSLTIDPRRLKLASSHKVRLCGKGMVNVAIHSI